MSPTLLTHLLLRSVERTPDAVALSDPKGQLSYQELWQRGLSYATLLAEAGVGPGDLVGLSVEKGLEAVAALYGILMRGAAYVPIDPQMPRARAELVCENASLGVVITSREQLDILAGAKTLERAILTRGKADPACGLTVFEAGAMTPRDSARIDVTEDYLAYVLHTSGSTGRPKGVAISHRNSLAFVEPAAQFFGIGPRDVLACQAPLHFDLSVFDLFCGAAAGAHVTLFPEFFSAFPKKMSQTIAERRVTILNCVVSALALLEDKGKLGSVDSSSLSRVLFSGERMPIPLLRRLRELLPSCRLFNVYGQTEANSSLVFEVLDVPVDDSASLPLGMPLPNFEVCILTKDGSLGDEGELLVCAPSVASGGYWGDPERSKDKFIDDPRQPAARRAAYRTGDLVRREANGALRFTGRVDDMIKTRGYRVELGEIDAALSAQAEVREFAVLALPDAAITHRLVAVIVGHSQVDLGLLTKGLGQSLPSYMVPELHQRAALPRTSSGKIDKAALALEFPSAPAKAPS